MTTSSDDGSQRAGGRSRLISATDLINLPIPPTKPIPGPIISRDGSGDVRCCGDALDEIWWRGAQWAVTSYGIECRDGKYLVAASRLLENDPRSYSWVKHLGEKTWCDIEDFTSAYFVACAMHGVRLTRDTRIALLRHLAKARGSKEFTWDMLLDLRDREAKR